MFKWRKRHTRKKCPLYFISFGGRKGDGGGGRFAALCQKLSDHIFCRVIWPLANERSIPSFCIQALTATHTDAHRIIKLQNYSPLDCSCCLAHLSFVFIIREHTLYLSTPVYHYPFTMYPYDLAFLCSVCTNYVLIIDDLQWDPQKVDQSSSHME